MEGEKEFDLVEGLRDIDLMDRERELDPGGVRELDLMDWERKVECARELETWDGVRELGLMEG